MYDYIAEDGTCYTEAEAVDLYDDYLDEDGQVFIAGIAFYPSVLLKRADPVSYRCGFSDWRDATGLDEWSPDHEWTTADED